MSTAVLAFAPSGRRAKSTGPATLTASPFEDEIGAQPPLGFFDPLGIVADGDETKFNRLRFVELKHGRISMLAVLGHIITTSGIRLPGNIDLAGTPFDSIPSGFAAFSKIPGAGIAQIVAFIGFLELAVMKDITGGEFVGKLGATVGCCQFNSQKSF